MGESGYRLAKPDKPVLIPEGKAAERAGLKKGLLKRAKEDGGGYLNLLRKTSHWNYPYYKNLGLSEFKNDDDILFEHYVRQQLMCTVDFNVFGQVWVEKTQTAFPDFMTTHRCKNFETVRQWAYENQIEGNPKEMAMPLREGDIVLAEAP
ncbi:hypothetical protein PRZ48_005542 [Zasmidium cellare]|uniref:Uncharacterized protein n=1 Tax=Zasmidium cellare TaxID=395010 RepID=A0ABR0EKM5_ZASCE|nr:hypothetical protein PRZ48_005542 [Zasmidium cellare]